MRAPSTCGASLSGSLASVVEPSRLPIWWELKVSTKQRHSAVVGVREVRDPDRRQDPYRSFGRINDSTAPNGQQTAMKELAPAPKRTTRTGDPDAEDHVGEREIDKQRSFGALIERDS